VEILLPTPLPIGLSFLSGMLGLGVAFVAIPQGTPPEVTHAS
jgi:hypothetical protein